MISPEAAIDVINQRFGHHPRHRALHAKGNWCAGSFTAAPVAREVCAAEHFSGQPVSVLARLSNGSGDPGEPDYAPDVRGLAVSFELTDGSRTDLVAQTVPRFTSSTADDFIALVRASGGAAALWRLPRYLATNRRALASLPTSLPALQPVASYGTARYFTVHAYRWRAPDGSARFTRCTWLPQAGDKRIGLREAKRRGRDYLRQDLHERLASGAIRFTLEAQVAGEGDNPDDPASRWPDDRERITVGTLELNAITPDPEADGGIVVFDPTRVTAGIELSADPVLHFRAKAYSESVERRVR